MTFDGRNMNGGRPNAGRPEPRDTAHARREMIGPDVDHFSSAPEIALVYPCRSLIDQLQIWADRCGGHHTTIATEEALPNLCNRDCSPDFIIVDATREPAKAADALMQIVDAFGEECVTMYTEIMHEGLETLVRPMGVSLLLGPMSTLEWNGYFDRKYSPIEPSIERPLFVGNLIHD
jgi:hypothetical protein